MEEKPANGASGMKMEISSKEKSIERKTSPIKGSAKDRLFKKLSRKTGKTVLAHKLIEPGDHILAGLSGGKDSLVLLEVLNDRLRTLPFDFKITAAYIHVIDSGYFADVGYLSEFCRELNIEFISESTTAGITSNRDKAPCFLCSWHRRKKLFDLTKRLNCNKLSLGHHRDDALETFMINMLYHGSVSSLPYSLKMFNGRIHLIRPLLDLWEEEIQEYASSRSYKEINKSCPHENFTKRMHVRELIEGLNLQNKNAKINMFRAMDNVYHEYLPKSKSTKEK